ncbi:MAG TPA: tRNA guanosine(34) transglycosylase Tgt, partial [Gemmatimonadales bacterium]|nr:tRNA guanosine(34) transglycosylase Tgt [Gemmatimonadales bacterium]
SLAERLPPDRPRYLMGVGFPEDLIAGIARGVDLFDCVAATRNGRHGSAWTTTGRVNIRKAVHRTADQPLDPGCDCATCARFSRGYLRHLFVAEEMLGLRLVSLHNVRFLVRMGEQAREAIRQGNFDRWSREWLRRYWGREEP